MGHEVNIHSIQALEKQIEEGKGDVIKLKRARNSLLNISTRIPPEILGYIFVHGAVRERNHPVYSSSHFDGPQKGSYNFLLVCHHWLEVAFHTPELWSFWGNTWQDWNRRCRRSGAAPIDLVLDGETADDSAVHGPLQDALKDRSTQDKIRKIHIRECDTELLASIISSLTPGGEDTREKCIESIILREISAGKEVSDFFTRLRLPNLRYLDIEGYLRTPLWDHLASQTTRLTTLSLQFYPLLSHTPTTPQLISVLASNPNLQELTLGGEGLPGDVDGPGFRAPLRHLKTISLDGELRRVLGLLHSLELPAALDSMSLDARGPTVEVVLQTLGPYVQDRFRRDTRFQDRLGISTSFQGHVVIWTSLVDDPCSQTLLPVRKPPFMNFTVSLDNPHVPPYRVMEKLHLDLMAFTPREHVVCFKTECRRNIPEELFVTMPNIEMLWLDDVVLSKGFLQPAPDGPHANTKLLPSLRYLLLDDVTLDNNDWNHLTTYLAHQTSDNQAISLKVYSRSVGMCPEMMDKIKDLVGEFVHRTIPESEDEDEDGGEDEDGL